MSAASGPTDAPAAMLVPVLIGGLVAITLGVYGHLHAPTGIGVNLAGFSGPLTVKVWLTTVSALLAVVQLVSALALYGRLPKVHAPSWTGGLHRWSGRAAFLCAVPVAVHCLYALGLHFSDPRTLLHSLAGCLFFGAFTAKMLLLRRPGLPGWALPIAGAVVFTALVVLWLTSSLWFFGTTGFRL
ncbi:hypothetical protein Asp14428_12930 [Actinoplanes sp. NBRC 14428]|uniref:Uncharacterized protein n=1 Tax=Pseudosporangium ferrugineum TaxID=439699 RepID=A0A2T0SEV7_9ACTN|nr:DUF6529 family protein [Pseudosporangium ferrugineum]PRY31944.1 hypothetical protein CLV70_102155 [Pseudosporangium ferrugineum]BCJ49818.1 hypothetical protein Asp14428_12930 [Actinoplanes sp. NBRC 14428]